MAPKKRASRRTPFEDPDALAVPALATATAHAAATARLAATAAATLAAAPAAAATTALSATATTAALTAAALAGTTLSAAAATTLAAAALAPATTATLAAAALTATTLAAAATAALTAAATAALAAAILTTHSTSAEALVPDVLVIEIALRSRRAVPATGASRAPSRAARSTGRPGARAAEALAPRAGASGAGAILLPTGATTRSTERPALRTSWGPAHSSLSALRAEILILVLVTIRHGRVLRTESGADVSRRRRAALGSAYRGNACAMSHDVRVNCDAHRG